MLLQWPKPQFPTSVKMQKRLPWMPLWKSSISSCHRCSKIKNKKNTAKKEKKKVGETAKSVLSRPAYRWRDRSIGEASRCLSTMLNFSGEEEGVGARGVCSHGVEASVRGGTPAKNERSHLGSSSRLLVRWGTTQIFAVATSAQLCD